MRKSLFALESDDEVGMSAEMEVGAEEGEAAGVMADSAEDMAEIGEMSDAVAEGTEASGQMGEVEELMEDTVENGEGLSPVAAEAIRISVKAICARVGANPRSVYSLYATENFQSESSRKANTRIALEGVGQFLKDLWERIKASLKTLWAKVTAFFEKHISSLGRIKKALESAKAKVTASSGKFKAQGSIEDAPSGLVNAFAGSAPISTTVINKYIQTHTAAGKVIGMLADANFFSPAFDAATGAIKGKFKADKSVEIGSASEPMVGGKYIAVSFGSGTANEEGVFQFEVTRETIDAKEAKLSVNLASKEELSSVLKAMLVLINADIVFKAKYTKYSSDQNKVLNDIGTMIAKAESSASTDTEKAGAKDSRNTLNFFYKVNAKIPSVCAEVVGANVTLAKAVLGYTGLCLKNYK